MRDDAGRAVTIAALHPAQGLMRAALPNESVTRADLVDSGEESPCVFSFRSLNEIDRALLVVRPALIVFACAPIEMHPFLRHSCRAQHVICTSD